MKRVFAWLNKLVNKQKAMKRWKRIVTVLAAVMTFVTTYALILPAITVERNRTDEIGGMYLEREGRGNVRLQGRWLYGQRRLH